MADTGVNVCWFCRNGRHKECMRKIPVTRTVSGSHDCSFDSGHVACACGCS